MLSDKQKEKLMENWGEKAECLTCNAEVRVYDPLSSWECYIYAMNPENNDEILCLISGFYVELCGWYMTELESCYNMIGEPPQLDSEYRPRQVSSLLKLITDRRL